MKKLFPLLLTLALLCLADLGQYAVVNDYRVCGEQINGNYPSDHLPVLVEYVVTK